MSVHDRGSWSSITASIAGVFAMTHVLCSGLLG